MSFYLKPKPVFANTMQQPLLCLCAQPAYLHALSQDTLAVSRVEQGLSAALPDESSVPGLARFNNGWIRKAQLRWDAMNHQWQRLVVNYDNDSQDKFWERLGLFNPTLLQITNNATSDSCWINLEPVYIRPS